MSRWVSDHALNGVELQPVDQRPVEAAREGKQSLQKACSVPRMKAATDFQKSRRQPTPEATPENGPTLRDIPAAMRLRHDVSQ